MDGNSKPLSKRIRFEVFKRDSFTCQYCGEQPPAVVLECDHIDPRALGGPNDPLNLITACSDCNRGKGALPLEQVPMRPDADLKYLEAQQEIAELKRYQSALSDLAKQRLAVAGMLAQYWCDISGLDWCPTEDFFMEMLSKFSPQVIQEGIEATAPKVASGYIRKSKWQAYLWQTVRRLGADDAED